MRRLLLTLSTVSAFLLAAIGGIATALPASATPMPFQVTIVMPAAGGTFSTGLRGFSGDINWDFGVSNVTESGINLGPTAAATHTYPATSTDTTYVIQATGTAPRLSGMSSQVQSVDSWGSLGITSLYAAFMGVSSAFSVPNWLPSNLTDMSYMFSGATGFNDPNVTYWVPSSVQSTELMFFGATSFNQPILWGSGATSITNLRWMFLGASALNNPISLSTSSATNMSRMFYGATSFNAAVNLDTGNVTDMSYMFSGATSFNKSLNFNTANGSAAPPLEWRG